MNQITKSHLALILASLLFGFNFWILKNIMPDYYTPNQIIFLRILVTVVLFWIVGELFYPEKIDKADIWMLILCGLVGVCINQIMFVKGLNFTTPLNASFVQLINPVLVLVFASILIKEKITPMKLAGVIIGMIGTIMLIAYNAKITISSQTFKGDIFILINATSYALFLVFVKPIMAKYNTFTVMKWIFLFGMLFTIPFTIGEMHNFKWLGTPLNVKLSLVYVIFFTTFITYLLITYSLKKVEAGAASSYIYIQPLIVVILGLWLGKEGLDAIKIISGIFICVGVYLVSKRNIPKKT